jgi:hypothetical protein
VETRCPKEGCNTLIMKAAGRPNPHNPNAPTGCARCGGPGEPSLMQCSKCHVAKYCSRECQAEDWGAHKEVCKMLRQRRRCIVSQLPGSDLDLWCREGLMCLVRMPASLGKVRFDVCAGLMG